MLWRVEQFRRTSTGIKAPNHPRKHTLNHDSWMVELLHARSMLSYSAYSTWCNWKRDPSNHIIFGRCSTVQSRCSCVNWRRFLVSAKLNIKSGRLPISSETKQFASLFISVWPSSTFSALSSQICLKRHVFIIMWPLGEYLP